MPEEEKRDELEKIIGAEKKKLKSKKEAPGNDIPKRESKMAGPSPQQAPPPMQQPAQQAPAEGFGGMQSSMMEGGAFPGFQQQQAPPQPMPQQGMQQPQPTMPRAPQEEIQEPEMPEPELGEMATIPSLPVAQLAYNRTNIEEIESLIESVVEEKWRQAMDSFQDFNLWKEKARTEIISIKQELLRLEQRFENMEKAMIGRVHEYDTHVLNIGAEIKAIEKVMQKIVQPLSQNVKELERIVKKMK